MIRPADLIACGKPHEKTTLESPLEHLVACHRRIEDRLATLERVTPFWTVNHQEASVAVLNSLRFFDTNGAWHTEDEEHSVFPRLRNGLTEEDRAYLAELERQHDEAEQAYAGLKEIVEQCKAAPVTEEQVEAYALAVTRLCAIYRAHIASEDARLPEMGRRILSTQQLTAISQEMKKRRGLPE